MWFPVLSVFPSTNINSMPGTNLLFHPWAVVRQEGGGMGRKDFKSISRIGFSSDMGDRESLLSLDDILFRFIYSITIQCTVYSVLCTVYSVQCKDLYFTLMYSKVYVSNYLTYTRLQEISKFSSLLKLPVSLIMI